MLYPCPPKSNCINTKIFSAPVKKAVSLGYIIADLQLNTVTKLKKKNAVWVKDIKALGRKLIGNVGRNQHVHL